ncbi:MAG: OmpH family outer membrane protein, partial [Paracoccaceae bacterium]
MIWTGMIWAGGALAQGQAQNQTEVQNRVQTIPRSPVLTIESDRLYAESAFGRQVALAIEAEGAALTTENRQIEAELTTEEQALTERRATLPPEDFRALADAFDARVIQVRRTQDAKVRVLNQRSEDARRRFLMAVQPVLEEIMRDSGALVLIERRNVVLDVQAINITDLAINRSRNILARLTANWEIDNQLT